MNRHDESRELLALRLYGELEEEERRRLDAHLSACETCSAFARELEAGLGALKPDATSTPVEDLPPGWRARLRAEIAAVPRRHPWRAAAAFAAGLLAGVAIMQLAPRPLGDGPGAAPLRFHATTLDEPLRSAQPAGTPPRSTGRGRLSALGMILRSS